MSWDAVILRIRGSIRPAQEVAESEYLALDSLKTVALEIRSAFPSAKFDTPTHAVGTLDPSTGIVFDYHEVPGYSFVHVSVSGSYDPIPSLLAMAQRNNWIILDIQNGDFIDPVNPSRDGWLGYRSLVHGTGGGELGQG
jgi:hypothetical protein